MSLYGTAYNTFVDLYQHQQTKMTYKLIAITIIVESSTLALAQCQAFYTSTLHLDLPVHAFVHPQCNRIEHV